MYWFPSVAKYQHQLSALLIHVSFPSGLELRSEAQVSLLILAVRFANFSLSCNTDSGVGPVSSGLQ